MVTKTLLETVFPPIITENFDIEKIRVDAKLEQINVDLVEKKTIPIEFSNRHVISHGYTESRKIQDFPIRGNAVFLYVKRRKWLDVDTGEILTRRYDIAFEGTGLTKEFVAFLKEAYRVDHH